MRVEAIEVETTRCRVLVVEDDPSSRRALTLLLRIRGFETTVAGTLHEAMQQLQWGPGCILLDLMLPDGNGAALLEHIRQSQLPIRVAVTTGAANWPALLDYGRLQPDVLFTKPLDIDRVVEWLNEATSPT